MLLVHAHTFADASGADAEALTSLCRLINVIPIVQSANANIDAFHRALESHSVDWLGPRQFAANQDSEHVFLTSESAYQALNREETLSYLRRRTARSFLLWRQVDLSARGQSRRQPPWDVAFDLLVAGRRRRLTRLPAPVTNAGVDSGRSDSSDAGDLSSSVMDSGAAADDEDVPSAPRRPGRIVRRRPTSASQGMCYTPLPLQDPVQLGSIVNLGLSLATSWTWDMIRHGWRVSIFASAVVGIFAAGIGLGWACSSGLAAVGQLAAAAFQS